VELKSDEDYVLVTRARRPNSSRFVTHVYGPFTQSKAKSVKANVKKRAREEGWEVEASACHIIDIDRMNSEAILNADA
jgi:hypothetical protein